MRAPLKELLEKLGVDREMHPYETQPWLLYDEDKGITCSAEVRMGPGGTDLETEIQFLYDDDAEIPEEDPDEEEGDEGEGKAPKPPLVVDGRMQVMLMRAEPVIEDQWSPKTLTVKGQSYINEMHDWEGKGCAFFTRCIQAIQMGDLPDIDDLIAQELDDGDGAGRGKRGRIGRKGLKMSQNPNLGIKKGM